LSLPTGIVVDSTGTLYIVDTDNQRVRRDLEWNDHHRRRKRKCRL
jgi:hypothetical protein